MIKAIIYATMLEGIRSKALYGVLVVSALMMAFTVIVCSMIMQDVGKVAVDFTLSTSLFSLLVVVLFLAINMLARDLERKTIYIPLSKAVSRSNYLVGRFFGISSLLFSLLS